MQFLFSYLNGRKSDIYVFDMIFAVSNCRSLRKATSKTWNCLVHCPRSAQWRYIVNVSKVQPSARFPELRAVHVFFYAA